jgi:tRNA 2-thiouridine synthesizing protein A
VSWFGRKEQRVAPARATGATTRATAGANGSPGSPANPTASAPEAALTIDALGRKCPIPIIWVAERIREIQVGEIVAVLADDPAAYSDVPAWCGMKSHEFVDRRELVSGWAFLIRRRY